MGTTSTVTIGAATHTVYGTVAGAADYLAASFQNAATWAALTPTQRLQCMVEATRVLNRAPWSGTRTAAAITAGMAWPRSGVTDRDGTAIGSAEIPDALEAGAYELAVIIAADADTQSAAVVDNIKRVKAGPVEVEKFRVASVGRFARPVQELVGQFLGGGVSLYQGGYASGTDTLTQFDDDYALGAGITDNGPTSE